MGDPQKTHSFTFRALLSTPAAAHSMIEKILVEGQVCAGEKYQSLQTNELHAHTERLDTRVAACERHVQTETQPTRGRGWRPQEVQGPTPGHPRVRLTTTPSNTGMDCQGTCV